MSIPHVAHGPVRNPRTFYGRIRELRELAAFLMNNQSISIIGPRKIGKTALLLHLMQPEVREVLGLGSDNLFIYLDCEVLRHCTHAEFFATFCTEMIAALDVWGAIPEPALESALATPTRMAFEAAVRRLNQRGLRIVFILDAFEKVIPNPDFDVSLMNALRSAAGRYNLVFLTASSRPLIELTYSNRSQEILSSPFFNLFAQLFLGLLSEEEARGLIHSLTKASGVPAASVLQDFIYKLVGGHPLALQTACFHAAEILLDFTQLEDKTKQSLLVDFEVDWTNLSRVEQNVLLHLDSEVSRAATDSMLRVALRDLTQKCLLVMNAGGYQYPSAAWADFVAARASDTGHA